MTRPRIAAIISAIAASAAAFLVVSRWGLLGTLTGAAVIPLVYTLVSHWLTELLDYAGNSMHRRMLSRAAEVESAEPAPESVVDCVPESGTQSEAGARPCAGGPGDARGAPETPSKRRHSKLEWSLAVFASLALAMSIYSLVLAEPAEKTIVRERVIEKTVTVTIEGDSVGEGASATAMVSGLGGSTTPTAVPESPDTASTTTTTSQPAGTAPDPEPSSTTTSSVPVAEDEASSSTTTTAPVTTTTLP